jgi:hypothetical protein
MASFDKLRMTKSDRLRVTPYIVMLSRELVERSKHRTVRVTASTFFGFIKFGELNKKNLAFSSRKNDATL